MASFKDKENKPQEGQGWEETRYVWWKWERFGLWVYLPDYCCCWCSKTTFAVGWPWFLMCMFGWIWPTGHVAKISKDQFALKFRDLVEGKVYRNHGKIKSWKINLFPLVSYTFCLPIEDTQPEHATLSWLSDEGASEGVTWFVGISPSVVPHT